MGLTRAMYLETRGTAVLGSCSSSFLYLGALHDYFSHIASIDEFLLEMWERMTFGGVKVVKS